MHHIELVMTFSYLAAILGFSYFCVANGVLGRLKSIPNDRRSGRHLDAGQRASL